jgi:hypothetical protein
MHTATVRTRFRAETTFSSSAFLVHRGLTRSRTGVRTRNNISTRGWRRCSYDSRFLACPLNPSSANDFSIFHGTVELARVNFPSQLQATAAIDSYPYSFFFVKNPPPPSTTHLGLRAHYPLLPCVTHSLYRTLLHLSLPGLE